MSKFNQVYDASLGYPGVPQPIDKIINLDTQKLIMFLTNVKMGSIMASVPVADLQALSTMDDYDKMLAMDRLSKQYGVSVANIEKQASALVCSIYKLLIKKTPVSTESIENAPCLVCPVESKCSLDGEVSPRTCQYIEDWVFVELKTSKSK